MLLSGRRLSGTQKRQFREALDKAFDYDELEQMLSDNFDKKIIDIILPQNHSFSTILDKIIEKADRESWTAALLQAVLATRPNDTQLIVFAKQFGPLLITPPLKELFPQSQGFERAITATPMHEHDNFLRGLWEHGSQVCRIEAKGQHMGTGFLVGPDLVMTCYHVWEEIWNRVYSADEFTCYFGYGSTSQGPYYLAEDYEIDVSKYNPNEGLPNEEAPTPDELDYALFRLAKAPGNEPTRHLFEETPSKRGWMTPRLQHYTFPQGSPLYILHYPRLFAAGSAEKPPLITLKLSMEECAIIESNGMRVKYTTNTENGSSGAPCFNANWELVAMHHFGDRNVPSQYNQGIPIAAIKKHVERNHKGIFTSFSQQASSEAKASNGHEAAKNTQAAPDAPLSKKPSSSINKRPTSTRQKSADSAPTTPQRRTKNSTASIDRSMLQKLLSKCLPAVFDTIVFNCDPPGGTLSGSQAPQGTRATELIKWAEGDGGIGLSAVYAYYREAMGIEEKKTPRNLL